MYRRKINFLLSFGICTFFATSAALAFPYQLSYSGRLTESSGKPISGPVDIEVNFYRSQNANDLVTGHSLSAFQNVALTDGVFQLQITLTAAEFHTIFNGVDPVWIQITDLTHAKLYPRQQFTAIPYALKVPVDGDSITFDTSGKLAFGNGNVILKAPVAAGALNKVLKSDGAGGLVWGDDLTAGTGTITTGDISDDAINSDKILDGTITNSDISGTAAISTAKLNGSVTAINGHGLGDAATKNVGTAVGTVAAGNHTHPTATSGSDGLMSAADKGKLDGIAAGAGVNTSARTECADGEYLRGDDVNLTCKTAGQIVADGSGVKTSDNGTVTGTMIANGTIENADVSNTAAIAGTKVAPDFGAQNVVTTGSITGSSFIGSGASLTNLVPPKGYIQGANVDYQNATSVRITGGFGEANGKYWEIANGTIHEMTSLTTTQGISYVYIDDAASTYPSGIVLSDSRTAPSWSDSKRGWYSGNNRCIGAVLSDSGGSSNIRPFKHNADEHSLRTILNVQPSSGVSDDTFHSTATDVNTVTPVMTTHLWLRFLAADTTPDTVNLRIQTGTTQACYFFWRGFGTVGGEFWLCADGGSRTVKFQGDTDDADTISLQLKGWRISR